MMQVDFQRLHDTLQEVVTAATLAHRAVTADFPEVREKIRELVAAGEYASDPLKRLFEAAERTADIVRDMERLNSPR